MCCHEFCQRVPHHSEDLAVLFIGMPLGCLTVAWLFLAFLMATVQVGLVCTLSFCFSCCFSIQACLASRGCHVRDLCHDMSAMALLTTAKWFGRSAIIYVQLSKHDICAWKLWKLFYCTKKLRSTELTYMDDYPVHSMFLLEAIFWDVALTFTNSEASLLLSATTILMVWQ